MNGNFVTIVGNAFFVQIGPLLTELLAFKANKGKVMQGSAL